MARLVLISGKGGVGKTTVAAATAVRACELGHRCVVVSVDRAHNLGDVLGTELGPEPSPVLLDGLSAFELDPQAELSRQWAVLSGYFGRLLAWAGVGGAQADEVAVFPGLEELLVLARVTELAESDAYDLVVVDLAPTASSLRLLSFPELMRGPLRRLAAWDRKFVKVARPALKRLSAIPVPEESVYDAIEVLAERIGRLRERLSDADRAVVRLVAIPERVVIDETRQAFTLMSLFGLTADAVVLNRVLPPELSDGYLGEWTRIQRREAERAEEAFPEVPLLRSWFQREEVIGARALSRLGRELYGKRDPAAAFATAPPLRFRRQGKVTVLELELPHAARGSLDLKEGEGELIVTVGGWRRRLPLPESLQGRAVQSARFAGGTLSIRFSPPPEEP